MPGIGVAPNNYYRSRRMATHGMPMAMTMPINGSTLYRPNSTGVGTVATPVHLPLPLPVSVHYATPPKTFAAGAVQNGAERSRLLELLRAPNNLTSPTLEPSSKGLLNGPGQNNCFLNCAVQDLKILIRRGVEGAPAADAATPAQLNVYYAAFEEQFFTECQHELTRVNNFFLEKLAEARRKHGTLKLQLLAAARAPGHTASSFSLSSQRQSAASVPASSSNRKLMTQRQLRNAYSEFYLTLVLLQNFQSLNETGFRKICKKYDKYLKSTRGANWVERNVSYAAFTDQRALQLMIVEVEELYTNYLAAGDRSRAMTKLRVPPLGQPTPPRMVFRAGVALGMFLMLALATLFTYSYANTFSNPYTWFFITSYIVSTVYCYLWDVIKDFGIFKIWRGEHLFLREKLVYPQAFYYFVIIENLLLRCFWAFEFVALYHKLVTPYNIKTCSSIFEITRRFIWNYIRLENEHLYNCGQFRATRDIHLAALNPKQERMLESMMGETETSGRRSDERQRLGKEYF